MTTSLQSFKNRHIGPTETEIKEMLEVIGEKSLADLAKKVIPESIQLKKSIAVGEALHESEVLEVAKCLAKKNKVFRSYIGLGYHSTFTPPVIQRNILENPGWYTQYTPYQAEIAQGRLEALINFQTMVCDLTAMDMANASLLDEGTAAAEAMMLSRRVQKSNGQKYFVSTGVHPQTIDLLKTRAEPLGIEIVVGDENSFKADKTFFGAILQYPTTTGEVVDYSAWTDGVKKEGLIVTACTDPLALCVLTPPGEWGADIAVGSSQRFGVPVGFGGPHAAFIATKDEYKRQIPGRIIGVSKDKLGNVAYRLSLQAREQHIRRESATSNICTAQVLLAIMAGMYAVYHGPQGLRAIAERIHGLTCLLKEELQKLGVKVKNKNFFDTLLLEVPNAKEIRVRAEKQQINFRYDANGEVGIALDETVTAEDLVDILALFSKDGNPQVTPRFFASANSLKLPQSIDSKVQRTSKYLTHSVFNKYHSETELLRYIFRLQNKDLSLTASMIPLGSCTMKLNATTEMMPITWPEFANIHPFVPQEQVRGYLEMISELEKMLSEITGLPVVSLQPNAGSQGEYAGLHAIIRFFQSTGQKQRNICLIPSSAHGTNPASAVLAGMKVVVVDCDKHGNVSLEDLKKKADEYAETLAAIMITYPSTHGVFEGEIKQICEIIHGHGGQVYMDGANMNAQVGLCRAGEFGVDVCHINLHKTFCIPHGGGGPGVGPIAAAEHLRKFMPGHLFLNPEKNPEAAVLERATGAVSSAPWGSAAILPISWGYIKLMGSEGLTKATEVAILNANYIAKRLSKYFPVLYSAKSGHVAHECILDLRNYKKTIGLGVTDVAKRLMDYSFHAPTVSFPVVETLMVEPTESESKAELDRFCEAMISVYNELAEVVSGKVPAEKSMLKNAPHTAIEVAGEWTHEYSREQAVFPVASLKEYKFWPAVSRIDDAYGDRNLFCSCPEK